MSYVNASPSGSLVPAALKVTSSGATPCAGVAEATGTGARLP